MDELDFIDKLENDLDFFNKKFEELSEFYNLRHMDEIFSYISKYKGIVILLNELKPYLIESFPMGKFDLIFDVDPEVEELSQIVLYVKVDEYMFDNGVMDEIKKITSEFISLRQKLGVMDKLSLMPALYNW